MTSPTTFCWKVTKYGIELMKMSGYFQHIKENQEVILMPENEKKRFL